MPGRIHFGVYELDPQAMELRKHGVIIRLQEQPLRVLTALVERPGEIVTREQLQAQIWGKDTFVDFEQSLNKAVNRLRETLNDNAVQPRYVETVPRRGYRFVAPVIPANNGASGQSNGAAAPALLTSTVVAVPGGDRGKRIGARWGFAVLAGVLLVTALAIAYLLRRPAAAAQQVTVVPFTSYPGAELNPSFSPDGNQIAFSWTGGETPIGDDFDLYVKQVGIERPVRLTTHPAIDVWPAWSPDGRFIAFVRTSLEGAGIYMIPAIGGSERKLADIHSCGCLDQLAWSPDGKWLAFADWVDQKELAPYGVHAYLLDPETLEKRNISDPSAQCVATYMPTFSPDGHNLALTCMLSIGLNVIYLQPAGGGAAQEIGRVNGKFGGLGWTADGKNLVYSTEGTLWRLPVTGGTAEQLVYANQAVAPTIARSGKRLAYYQENPYQDVWRLDLATPTKLRGAAQRLVPSSYAQWGPHLSSDGRRIVFNSNRSGMNQVWVSDSDGTNPVQLTSFARGALGVARWSPDGQRITFDTDAGSPNVEAYTMSVDGGLPQRLNTATDTASHPSWSGDGHWIYFDQQRNGGGIWKAPAQGGKAVQLTHDGGVFPQESADGTRVFYVHSWDPPVLWSAAVAGGDEHPVAGMPTLTAGWHWVPARSGIYFIDGNTKPASLNLFDLATHRVQRVGLLNGGVSFWGSQLSVSRDGRILLYSNADRNEADIMLAQGFH